mgnify:CR=1 FL=1
MHSATRSARTAAALCTPVLVCTLWQVLTTDATFVTNPARVLGAHPAPAVVRCARCVSPPHRALPHLQCELCAPHEPLCWWWSFVTRRPASLAAAPARTTTRPRARPSDWCSGVAVTAHNLPRHRLALSGQEVGSRAGSLFAGARVAIEVRHRRTYSLRDLAPPTSWRPRLRPQLSALARHRSAGR